MDAVCTNCGKAFARPGEIDAANIKTIVEQESARCVRLTDLIRQRESLASRMQGGVAGLVGHDTLDTVDMVAQRASLRKLDATLKQEEEELQAGMSHVPAVT